MNAEKNEQMDVRAVHMHNRDGSPHMHVHVLVSYHVGNMGH